MYVRCSGVGKDFIFMKRLIFCLVIFCSLIFLNSCNANKHFMELRGSFSFDAAASALIKYPSEFMFEPNEILAYYPENSRTRILNYQVVHLVFQRHDDIIGGFYDYDVGIAFTVHNDRLLIAQTPNELPLFQYFRLGDSTDSVIITVGHDNAYLVNLNTESIRRLFNDGEFNNYFNKDSIKDLVFAEILSVSPDGRYILYRSNRNFIDDALPNHFELFFFDIQTGAETKIMNFNNKEILTWDRNNPDTFLFRELRIAPDGARYSSPIMAYSLGNRQQSVFLNLNEKYRAFEMIDDEYIYILRRTVEDREDGSPPVRRTTLYIANIYTQEAFGVDVGIYNIEVWNVRISDTKEYLAFWGTYMIPTGLRLTDLVTVHIPTNNIMPHYEQAVDHFVLTSFYWAPNNILIVNFHNTIDVHGDVSRFHRITHTARGAVPNINRVYDLIG